MSIFIFPSPVPGCGVPIEFRRRESSEQKAQEMNNWTMVSSILWYRLSVRPLAGCSIWGGAAIHRCDQ
jgi:hypothetical protein